jgi:hypothetical protein
MRGRAEGSAAAPGGTAPSRDDGALMLAASAPHAQDLLAFKPISYTPWPVASDAPGERVRVGVGKVGATEPWCGRAAAPDACGAVQQSACWKRMSNACTTDARMPHHELGNEAV